MPTSLGVATSPEHDLYDEAAFRRLDFTDIDLGGQAADAVEFEECGLRRVSLAGVALERARFTDCLVEGSDWANLRAAKSDMQRVRLAAVRLTGVHWLGGVLRDVTFSECRMDMATLRFTSFKDVAFVGCNLTRADFTNADLRGAQFTDCDLSGAQFTQADCAGTRFIRCELAGIGGAASLRGATIGAADLVALTYALAAALDITIEES
ncbi:pentapeptide repeat-containing protein [Frankia sp. CNm7]|uniref:Pentapeptide repeat-containing protein n=1 Tax=Frankia nepalensis TaxID=1836974 RepID=A0A937RIF4_9ACTN|nr:pentapeptide repeat-containing protein [Frankia nepalensis]MBL7500427.1 pentapeptide repeat-containing protein [Frankia nepalensis]MBL7511086.1 pentapeptide repeat-containing protein [Frankia nepalensis]MBL7523117.1 pentapeptide repeat-containing protein [Frankia nepalensis]MBL7626948.1 pentapeptide repeat-containing protein [Frankia nepalensis]